MEEEKSMIDIKSAKKEITLEEWRKKANNLEPEYKTLDKLREDAMKMIGESYHYITDIPITKMVIVYPFGVIEYGADDERIHLSRDAVFYFKNKGLLRRLDTEKLIDTLVLELVPYVTVEPIIRDALYDTNPDDLKEMYERVVIKKGSVKEKPGCYKLVIGGKRGTPFQFMLRD